MGYKISEFSNISGLSASNIRYYEQRGFPLSERSDSGYRQYQFEDSYRINTFNALLAHGFSVSEAIALMNPHPAEDLTKRLQEKNQIIALLLRGEDAEKEIKEDRRILTMIQNGYSFPETFFHVYMMLNTEEFGSDLNYVFLKK